MQHGMNCRSSWVTIMSQKCPLTRSDMDQMHPFFCPMGLLLMLWELIFLKRVKNEWTWDDCSNHSSQVNGIRKAKGREGRCGVLVDRVELASCDLCLCILLPTCHFRKPCWRRGAVVRRVCKYLLLGSGGTVSTGSLWEAFSRACFWLHAGGQLHITAGGWPGWEGHLQTR